MLPENEIIMLLLGIGVFILTVVNRQSVKRIPEFRILMTSFYILLSGWVMTVFEGVFWAGILNVLEHVCYTGSSLVLLFWCWKLFREKKEPEK